MAARTKRQAQRVFVGREQSAQFLRGIRLGQRQSLARQFHQRALQRFNLRTFVLGQATAARRGL